MVLSAKTCKACRKGDPALTTEEAKALLAQVPLWSMTPDGKELQRLYDFKAYLEGAAFVQKVAAMAQLEDHHPDIELNYKKVLVRWTTHSVGGLSLNDFICASKCDLQFM